MLCDNCKEREVEIHLTKVENDTKVTLHLCKQCAQQKGFETGDSILKSPLKECIVEPRVGGRWYAVGEDGSSCETGYVIAWQPPQVLVLAWQINAEWQFDPELVTEVEVRFIAESADTTRVELEHRHLERMGGKAAEARDAVDSPGGWGAILGSFKICAES